MKTESIANYCTYHLNSAIQVIGFLLLSNSNKEIFLQLSCEACVLWNFLLLHLHYYYYLLEWFGSLVVRFFFFFFQLT